MKQKIIFLMFFLVFVSSNAQAQQQRWYVDNESTCTVNCGSDWGLAFNNIQNAIDIAAEGDEIWVKEGTYALSAEIAVNKAVSIYG